MAVVAILLGICTAAVLQAAPTIVEVRTAAPTVLVVVIQTDITYEPEGGTGEDPVDETLANWQVNGVSPTDIHRYSIPWDELPVQWNPTASYPVTTRHRMYLRLSNPLVENQSYNITHPQYGSTNIVFSARTTFCESIKVNQVGYSKLSTTRFANFGVYMGDGGSMTFNPAPSYEVINQSGAVIASGQAMYKSNDTALGVPNSGEHVYRLSLNAVPEGGPYFVSVIGAGRSHSFGIGDAYSAQIANAVVRGMYLHRCGIALTQPYTPFTHAICHTTVYDVRSGQSQDNVSVPQGTPPMYIEGGYHDAGDMDHTEGHPLISILMLSFFEAFPNRFVDNQYNIPESGNNIPDFLDEIMWGVRMWEYLQISNPGDTNYGGVRSGWSTLGYTGYGYEGAANDTHVYGTKNVQEDCQAMVAGIFAQASRLIRPYDVPRADALLNRAQVAWNYLASHWNVNQAKARYVYAPLQLYLATGNSAYHDIFRANVNGLIITGGQPWPETYWPGNGESTCQTAHFVSYLLPHGQSTDATLVQNLKNKILYYADNGTYMGPPPENEPYPQGVTRFLNYGAGTCQGRYADCWIYGTLFTTDPVKLQKYTNAVCQYADYPLGLNPQGMSYYTGLGVDQPNSPLDCASYYTKYGTNDGVTLNSGGQLDNHRDGNGNPIGNVPGIIVYGPYYEESLWYYVTPVTKKMRPVWNSLPGLRRYAHGHTVVQANEFTVAETMAWNVPMYAFLAMPGNQAPVLSATLFSCTQINLSWTDPSNNEDGFKIERKTGAGGTYAQIATVGANVTTYNDTTVAANTTYYYRVRWYKGTDHSPYSNEAIVITQPPAAPSGLTATAVSSSQINVCWTDNANGETGFKIERKTGAGGTWAQIATVGPNLTCYNNTGLTPNTTYYYRVRAYNGCGDSTYSNEANATTQPPPPPRPSVTALRAGAMTVNGSLSESGWSINTPVKKTIYGTPNNTVTFGVLWDNTYLYVGVKVVDGTLFNDSVDPWEDDSVEIYIDGNHNQGTSYDAFDRQIVKAYNDGTIWVNGSQTTGILHGWAAITGGYSVEVAIPWSNLGITVNAGTVLGLDVGCNDDDNGALRESQLMWSGTANNWTDTSQFGDLTLSGTASSAITAQRAGPMTINGSLSESDWSINNPVTKTVLGTPNNTVNFGVLWDSTYLYVGVKVLDANLFNDSVDIWQDDSVEIYIDGNHNKGTSYDAFDRQIVKGYNDGTFWVSGGQTAGILHAWAAIAGGYSVEIAIPWSNLGITANLGTVLGLDVGYNDDDNGGLREGQAVWAGTASNWTDTSAWGDVMLAGSCVPQDTVWFDDALPTGAQPSADGGDSWSWVTTSPSPFSGIKSHQSAVAPGSHQHFFDWASQTMSVTTGDKLIAYVYLDPANLPSEIMLQWRSATDGWEHRAYWGANLIGYGVDGTPSRRYMGPLPAAGQWVRLEVPASQVALVGHTAQGMAFTLYNGSATWDFAGKSYDLAWQAAADGIGTRVGHSTVFTGTEVIIWGGGRQGVFLNDGARYNLANNTWTTISQVGAPAGRWHHAAVWTGTEMIVWGGRADFFAYNHFNDGFAYNPANNTWRPITTTGAPVGRSHMAAVWTGSQMLVWAGLGEGDVELADGARYNVAADSWTAMAASPLEARNEPSAVWTGTEMITFGGLKYEPAVNNWYTFGDGARYNPANNTWTLVSSVGAPSSRTAASTLWTGTEMLVWGGRFLPDYTFLNTGARYNPANNTWTPMTTANAPQARLYHAGVWTGSEMIVWGGHIDPSGTAVNTGGLYSPSCDTWRATSVTGAPTARFFGRMDCGIWTGNSGMFIYGGWGPYPWELNSAALYKRP